ncbi:MAG: DNA methyltransferase [Anaerolineae bacterium]|nr:DNA methyltransferase [Anaerolineae bacterium]
MHSRLHNPNELRAADRAAHDWYRFVLSFPPHLVREYLQRFNVKPEETVLDPFCGTGTTLVECKRLGIPSQGVEANPVAYLASRVKTNWQIDPDQLLNLAHQIAEEAHEALARQGIEDNMLLFHLPGSVRLRSVPPEAQQLLLKNSIDPLPLHKTLILLDTLNQYRENACYQHLLLALAKSTVQNVSNLRFAPEVSARGSKPFAPVISPWLSEVRQMASDLKQLSVKKDTMVEIFLADSRYVGTMLPPESVSAVITSPPYPNEKDYTRTTRLELVLLGFLRNRRDLRALKQTLIRSNTRTVYKHDADDQAVRHSQAVDNLANQIESRRIALGKTSGFERLYSRVIRLYFGGLSLHLASLRSCLRPNARLAYVVGDQASYFRVKISTGTLLAEIAENLGYVCESIDLFRMRSSTAHGEQLREEVVVLQWLGK